MKGILNALQFCVLEGAKTCGNNVDHECFICLYHINSIAYIGLWIRNDDEKPVSIFIDVAIRLNYAVTNT